MALEIEADPGGTNELYGRGAKQQICKNNINPIFLLSYCSNNNIHILM